MKCIISLGLIAGGMLAAAAETGHSAWQWEQSIQVPAPGMIRLDLPPPTLDASLPDLADLRVLSPKGVETPCLTVHPPTDTARTIKAVDFTASLLENAPGNDAATVLECATGTGDPIRAVTLESPAREFIKSVNIEGTRDGAAWQSIATREVIFRQPGGAGRMTIPLKSAVWQRLRFTLSDVRSKPIAFTGIAISVADHEPPETVAHPVNIRSTDEVAGTTRVTIDSGFANLHLADLKLTITDPVFSRQYSLAYLSKDTEGRTAQTTLAEGTLFRVLGEQDTTTEQLVIPIMRRVPAKQLVLTLRNGDSPPLTLTGASARRFPSTLVFHAAEPGNWRLLTGNPKAKPPRYDLEQLSGNLSKVTAQHLSPGPLHARADFQAPPGLPGVEPAGAAIDLTQWSFRRAVQAPASGVIGIELDPSALAHTDISLNDLRLVQNGLQIPYLIVPNKRMRTIPATIAVLRDPKRSNVSRWEVSQPFEGIPAVDMLADSPSPLFIRTLIATADRKDELGNAWTQQLGSATWTKAAAPDGSSNSFTLGFGNTRLPALFLLETSDGDNPPIKIENVRLRYAAPVMAAKLVADAPLFLYYGNPQAAAPSYDLRLVRNELLAADKQSATLAAEEPLRPDHRKSEEVSPGSPWLWAALALVVAVLLFVVARMLPKGDSGLEG